MSGIEQLPTQLRSKVAIDENGCWVWTASFVRGGYGQVVRQGKHWVAHRLTYVLLVGPVPEGLQLDHLCRVRACVNPAHLEPVTAQENVRRSPFTYKDVCTHGHPLVGRNLRMGRDAHGYNKVICVTCETAARQRTRLKRQARMAGEAA